LKAPGSERLTLKYDQKPTLKAPGSERLILEYDQLVSNFGFIFNLRRYIMITPPYGISLEPFRLWLLSMYSLAGKAWYHPRHLVIFTMFTNYFMVIHTK